MSDVSPKAAPGTLWKPAKREKTPAQGLRQQGKTAKARAADKRSLMKEQPAEHDGRHLCYIGNHWVERVDLEHVIDASLRPDLARDPRNHKKACNAHNIAKKNGTLTEAEEIRVQNAIEQVLFDREDKR